MSQKEGYNHELPFLSFHSRGETDMDPQVIQINVNLYQDNGWQSLQKEHIKEKTFQCQQMTFSHALKLGR